MVQDAEAKDGVRLDTRHHRIELTTARHVLTYDIAACFSKAESQQVSNLHDGLLEDQRLVLCVLLDLLIIALVFLLLHEGHQASLVDLLTGCDEGVLGDGSDLLDHPFEWVKH